MRRVGGIVVVSILVAGCAGGGASPSAAPAASTTPSAAPAPTSPPTGSPAASAADAWDVVWVSDSSGSGGVPEAYGRRIETDLGVGVRVQDAWTAGLTARNLLEKLQGKDQGMLGSAGSGSVNLLDLVREAEVIVISGNPLQSETAGHPQDQNCPYYLDPDPACKAPTACGPETWQQYEDDLVAIFDEVFRIRQGRPVILRTHDWYLPWGPVASWQTCDQVKVCAPCFGEFSDAIHRAAETRGIPVAGYYAAFSGPNGDQPLPSAWTRDDVHPTEAGAEALAGVMAELGYDPVAPTGN